MLKTTVRLQELQEQHYPVLPVYVCFGVYYCVAIGIIYYFCQGRQGNLYSSLISNCLGVFYIWGQRHMDPTQLSPVSKGLNIKSSVPARLEDTVLSLGLPRNNPGSLLCETLANECEAKMSQPLYLPNDCVLEKRHR